MTAGEWSAEAGGSIVEVDPGGDPTAAPVDHELFTAIFPSRVSQPLVGIKTLHQTRLIQHAVELAVDLGRTSRVAGGYGAGVAAEVIEGTSHPGPAQVAGLSI